MYVFDEPAQWDFEKLGHRGKSFPAGERVSHANYTVVEISGEMPTVLRQRECEFVYYVLDGTGSFVIDGVASDVGRGNLVTVPTGAPFTYGGALRMLLVSSPPWTADQEDDLGPPQR